MWCLQQHSPVKGLVLHSWFVLLGLTLGFWFQVGSHSCCQGDSGARGKKPLLFYLRPSPFCDHPKKKSINIFLLLHFCSVTAENVEMLFVLRELIESDLRVCVELSVFVTVPFDSTRFVALWHQSESADIVVLSRCMAWHTGWDTTVWSLVLHCRAALCSSVRSQIICSELLLI